MNSIPILSTCALLAAAPFVAAAEPALSPAAARELAELERLFVESFQLKFKNAYVVNNASLADSLQAELRSVIEHYRRTGDARHASEPHRITLLHMACAAHRCELVRELLAAGAKPTSRIVLVEAGKHEILEPLTLISFNTFTGDTKPTAANGIRLIDMLVAAGADARGSAGGTALLLLCSNEHFKQAEDVALHLLQLGANPAQNDMLLLFHSDNDKAYFAQQARAEVLTSSAVRGWQRMVSALLDSGCEAELHQPHRNFTPLGVLVSDMLDAPDDDALFHARAACVALMLQRGADPHATNNHALRPTSVADYIHSNPRLLAYLDVRGLQVPRTPRPLRAETLEEDLLELPMYACPPLEQLRPHEDAFYALLTAPSRWNTRADILRFLWQLDAPRCSQHLLTLDMWQTERPWTGEEELLFDALKDCSSIALPGEALVRFAEHQQASGQPRRAHDLVHLLARDPSSAPIVERLCQSDSLAISAAAWTARLRLAGLDNLPRLSPDKLCAPGSANHNRLTGLTVAVDKLACCGIRGAYFIDFDRFGKLYDMLGTIYRNGKAISTDEAVNELAASLRDAGETDTATYVLELHALYSRLSPENQADENSTKLTKEQEESLDKRLRSLLAPAKVEAAAYTVERPLARLIWQLHEKRQNPPAPAAQSEGKN